MRLCVIPARGGSKRIPRKNIRHFCGKPMIAWSIQAAQRATCFDKIVVSTDDDEIAKIAESFGADVPFIRPSELSDDFSGTAPVIAHAIRALESSGLRFDWVCCLYATAPFVRADEIDSGLELGIRGGDGSPVVAATQYPYPIQRALKKDPKSGKASMWYPEYFSARSQDLPEAYHDAGQFSWATSKLWRSAGNMLEGAMIFSLPSWRVIDIDTEEDWKRAELIFNALSGMFKEQ